MKISAASFFLLATLSLYSAVEASPLSKRGCYNGGGKQSTLTNYWIPHDGATDMDNDGHIMHLTGPKNTALRDTNGKTIAKVNKPTFEKCKMEGSCYIHRGGKEVLINLANDGGSDARFMVLEEKAHPFGMGSRENSLRPYISVAANDLKFGTTLYVKEFDGMKLPNGLTHNGCVSVDDGGWSFGGCQLDFFVLEYDSYVKLQTPDKVTVSKQRCKLRDYTTSKEYAYIGAKPPKNKGNGGGVGFHHKSVSSPAATPTDSPSPKPTPSSDSCNASGDLFKAFSATDMGGSSLCASGSGCHKLSGVTKSAQWPSGKKLTFFADSDCSGETLYVDSAGEDTDISGDGSGFHAGSVMLE